MEYYADLNSNNRVVGVKQVKPGYVNDSSSIPIENFDANLMGTTYKGNGVFEGYYIALETDKAQVAADGTDTAAITAKVYNYLDELQQSFENIVFEADGVQDIVPYSNGQAQTTFTTAKSGEFKVVTKNETDIIRNGEVIINAE